MEEVKAKLQTAREAVQKLGKSQLASIKTMKSPSPTIKRVITAVYLLLNSAKLKDAPRAQLGRVDWEGGVNSCQGLLGRKDFTEQVWSEAQNWDTSSCACNLNSVPVFASWTTPRSSTSTRRRCARRPAYSTT